MSLISNVKKTLVEISVKIRETEEPAVKISASNQVDGKTSAVKIYIFFKFTNRKCWGCFKIFLYGGGDSGQSLKRGQLLTEKLMLQG